MQEDIFQLLMLILLLECGGNSENINQIVLMFLMMQSRGGNIFSSSQCCPDEGFTF